MISEAEQFAVLLLAGVGKPDGEWWIFRGQKVGHLRVGLTEEEVDYAYPSGCPVITNDAGESGPYRARTSDGSAGLGVSGGDVGGGDSGDGVGSLPHRS